MDKSYKENWDFYFTQIEDSPVSVFVDLGLNRVLPVAEKSICVNHVYRDA